MAQAGVIANALQDDNRTYVELKSVPDASASVKIGFMIIVLM